MENPLEILSNIKLIKKDYDQLKNKKSVQEIKQELGKKYPKISDNYPAMFDLVFKPVDNWETDLAKLEQMVNLANRIKKNEISQHDASVEIGTSLVDQYVKPKLEKQD